MKWKLAIAVRHVPFEDLGSFESVLARSGYEVRYIDAVVCNWNSDTLIETDLFISLGGPISVNDTADFPFLDKEITILKRRMEKDLPTIGICLGAQLMAKALGAEIKKGRKKEIGWLPLELTKAAENSPLQFFNSNSTKVFHWHGEVFDLPMGATLLATTPSCDVQAFQYGKKCIAFQFHPEADFRKLEQWYIGHTMELGIEKINTNELREISLKEGPSLLTASEQFLIHWLESI